MLMGETWSQLGSLIATAMFLWAMFGKYFPYHLCSLILSHSKKFASFVYPYIQIKFHEFTSEYLKRSEAYAAIETYLSEKSSSEAKNLKAVVVKDSSQSVQLSMDENEEVTDEFEGIKVWWVVNKITPRTQSFSFYPEMEEKRYYKLTFHKSHQQIVWEIHQSCTARRKSNNGEKSTKEAVHQQS